ncbi:MAG TPA: SsgA family sporulation/cell division regulator [Marmoricola sp.]|jgi:hypothetical protein|nr:SsgA family sporulation/cell division regulator [Marmoricola sp.]
MSTSRQVIATQLPLATAAEDLELDGGLRYDPADPFAVSLRMTHGDQEVVWTFARELLSGGLYEPTGDGDVHVWPCLSRSGTSVVMIELCSPDGELVLEAPSRTVSRFLDEVEHLVPSGSEHIDVDALVAQLLSA